MNATQNQITDSKVSTFENAFSTKPCGEISIVEFIERCLSNEFKTLIDPIRDVVSNDEEGNIAALKKRLPAVNISGTINDGERAQALQQGRFTHSGCLQCDFDRKELSGHSADEARDMLRNDPYIVGAFLSPSGQGVKAILHVASCSTEEEHLRAFKAAQNYFFATYGLTLDPQTKDPSRLCFVSHDPQGFKSTQPTVPMPLAPPDETPLPKAESPPPTPNTYRKWTRDEVAEMLSFIPPRRDYEEWLRIASAAWNELGEQDGTAVLEAWSPPYKPGESEEKYPDRLKRVHIGTLIHLAREQGWQFPAGHSFTFDASTTYNSGDGFEIHWAHDLDGSSETIDFVEDLLTEGGASVVYGPSNCGKTFWVLSLGMSVATGRPFLDQMDVDQGAVIYVALEGSHGIKNRIRALKEKGLLPENTPLFLCFAPVSLMESADSKNLAESVKKAASESDLPCRLVIIDTLSRAMAGGDENSGKDMSFAVKSIDAIREATGAHVCVIHHCGKEVARGARGHSSLRAAVDTEIEISRPSGSSVSLVHVTKQRDLEAREPMAFSLESVTLGSNRRGKTVTSCVVRPETVDILPAKPGRKAKTSEHELLDLLPVASTTEWLHRADTELGIGKTTFYDHLKKIKASGLVIPYEKNGWEAKIQFFTPKPQGV